VIPGWLHRSVARRIRSVTAGLVFGLMIKNRMGEEAKTGSRSFAFIDVQLDIVLGNHNQED
jgi:hypothetical protein